MPIKVNSDLTPSLLRCFIACSNDEAVEETESNTSITINEEITWSKGIGNTPEEFVTNWNKLINC